MYIHDSELRANIKPYRDSIMKSSLEAMNCWSKYKSYTASNNIPKVLRESDAIVK